MPKAKKDAKQICINMDRMVAERLEAYCEETGMSKTVAIERLLMKAMDDAGKEAEMK